jgi:hypothetical protein
MSRSNIQFQAQQDYRGYFLVQYPMAWDKDTQFIQLQKKGKQDNKFCLQETSWTGNSACSTILTLWGRRPRSNKTDSQLRWYSCKYTWKQSILSKVIFSTSGCLCQSQSYYWTRQTDISHFTFPTASVVTENLLQKRTLVQYLHGVSASKRSQQ